MFRIALLSLVASLSLPTLAFAKSVLANPCYEVGKSINSNSLLHKVSLKAVKEGYWCKSEETSDDVCIVRTLESSGDKAMLEAFGLSELYDGDQGLSRLFTWTSNTNKRGGYKSGTDNVMVMEIDRQKDEWVLPPMTAQVLMLNPHNTACGSSKSSESCLEVQILSDRDRLEAHRLKKSPGKSPEAIDLVLYKKLMEGTFYSQEFFGTVKTDFKDCVKFY